MEKWKGKVNMSHTLVHNVPHVYQFKKGHSLYRCVAYVLASLIAFAYPGKYQDLDDLARKLYEEYAGPDVESNTAGMTKAQAIECLQKHGVGFVDLQHFLDAGDIEGLRHEMAAMNRAGIPQLLTIGDESHMKLATNGTKLHNWNDAGLSHCIVRLGMEDQAPIGYYLDPAAPCPPFPFPTPVEWADIAAAQPITALGIMPPGVSVPPADFRFFAGKNEDGSDKWNMWPAPKPHLDLDAAASTLHAIIAAAEQMAGVAATLKSASNNALSDIGK